MSDFKGELFQASQREFGNVLRQRPLPQIRLEEYIMGMSQHLELGPTVAMTSQINFSSL